jgi:hypothetical protein
MQENSVKKRVGSSQNKHLKSTGLVGKDVTFFAAKLGELRKTKNFRTVDSYSE